MENHGRTGQRTQKWQKVSGEISTPENSWRTTLSLFHLMKVLNDNDHCLGFGTWWPDHNWVFQFNISWWEGSCTGSWRGRPCQNTKLPALMYLQDRTMIPVTVDVSIVLLKIVEIEEENHAIDFQYEIIMKVVLLISPIMIFVLVAGQPGGLS